MLTCEECGCLVDPEATEIHQNWHETLVKIDKGSVANPRRIKLDDLKINMKNC